MFNETSGGFSTRQANGHRFAKPKHRIWTRERVTFQEPRYVFLQAVLRVYKQKSR